MCVFTTIKKKKECLREMKIRDKKKQKARNE